MLTILNVAIGIVFVYLLFSLIVSAANEVIQSALAKRQKYLWDGIYELLQERATESKPGSIQPSKEFCNHPLIQSLSKGANGMPSYIPSKLFATTVLDLIKTGRLDKSGSQEGDVGSLIDRIENDDLKRALKALWNDAIQKEEAFKESLENWFNNAMDRVSGWYKRYTQYWLLVLAVICAAACNVDSIRILQVLSTDPRVSQSVVDEAKKYLEAQESVSTPSSTPAPSSTGTPSLANDAKKLEAEVENLQTISLPVGWSSSQQEYFQKSWLMVVLGWILTALAGSLGAPFWFDTLDRFMNVRAAGKVPEQPAGDKTAATNNGDSR